jgi:predicted MFS family arabinose efflux permease
MTAADAAAIKAGRTPAYSWVVLAMLCFIYIFNFMDRQLMGVLGEQIKADLQLSDTQLGLMTGLLFALFYTLLGVVAGWLADKTVRVRVLAAGCFLWSLFTILCGRANSFPVMAVARMGVGVGEAAGAPPSYSIVSDYFPAHKRGLALALFSMGVPFGMAIGTFGGPEIAEMFNDENGQGGWRMAFVIIGVAGIIASGLLLLVVREPKRGAMDVALDIHMEEAPPVAAEKTSFVRTINEFFGRPLLLSTAFACGLVAFVGYATLAWTSPFLQRVTGGLLSDFNAPYALILAIAMGAGTWMSGALVDKLVTKSKTFYALLPAAAIALCIPFHILFVGAPTWQMALVWLAFPTFLNIFYLAPALAVVQNSVKPSQRTMSGALLLMVLNLIGLGGGPTMVGILSDGFATSALAVDGLDLAACRLPVDERVAACAPALSSGLKSALYWLVPFYVLAVVALLIEAWMIRREIRNGPPGPQQVAKNAMLAKLVIGFGGIALILIGETLAFGEPVIRDLAGFTGMIGGAEVTPTVVNGLIRTLLIVLLGALGLFGISDFLARKKAA